MRHVPDPEVTVVKTTNKITYLSETYILGRNIGNTKNKN